MDKMVEFLTEEDKLVCRFSGSLDTTACMAIDEEVDAQVSVATGPVVFDLKEAEFICSMFLRICLRTIKAAGIGNFFLRNASPHVKRVFIIAGLDRFFHGGE